VHGPNATVILRLHCGVDREGGYHEARVSSVVRQLNGATKAGAGKKNTIPLTARIFLNVGPDIRLSGSEVGHKCVNMSKCHFGALCLRNYSENNLAYRNLTAGQVQYSECRPVFRQPQIPARCEVDLISLSLIAAGKKLLEGPAFKLHPSPSSPIFTTHCIYALQREGPLSVDDRHSHPVHRKPELPPWAGTLNCSCSCHTFINPSNALQLHPQWRVSWYRASGRHAAAGTFPLTALRNLQVPLPLPCGKKCVPSVIIPITLFARSDAPNTIPDGAREFGAESTLQRRDNGTVL
jgi:hypothetical protein